MGAADAFMARRSPAAASCAVVATNALAAASLPPADSVQSLGLMRIGDAVLALPVEMLSEVLPCPAVLAPLPMVAVGLRGAMQVRGSVIPVLDLRPTLGIPVIDIPAVDTAASVIVVMRWSGRLLGLLADGVAGMARVRPRDLHALDVAAPFDAAPRPATHFFQHGDSVATLLDAAQIAALPGVPMVREPSADSDDGRDGRSESMLLFNTGGLHFGIAAMSVDATVSRTALRANALKNAICRGVIDHHGLEVPVIDTLAFLGLGEAPAETTESAVLVLRFDSGRIGLMLDEVRDISLVPLADILPLPRLALDKADLFRGVLGSLSGTAADDPATTTPPHLLLDDAALRADPVLRALASLSHPKATPETLSHAHSHVHAPAHPHGHGNETRVASSGRVGASYMTYQVGVETASPLVQVSEILPYPENAAPLRQGREAGLGLFTHRGAAVPLVCLCSLLGRPVELDRHLARVLLVRDGGETIGFVVQGLRSIERAHWEQAEKATTSSAEPATLSGLRRFQPLVEVGVDAQRRTLPRLDLLLLARALRQQAVAVPEVLMPSD